MKNTDEFQVEERQSSPQGKGKRLFAPGQSGNPAGKPKGAVNRVTKTIREAVLEASQPGNCHPEGLTGWLIDRARGGVTDRQIFANLVGRALPIEVTGKDGEAIKVELGWLSGRRVSGEVIDITPTTQNAGKQEAARLPTDFQSELPENVGVPAEHQVAAAPAKRTRSKSRKGESE